MKFYNKNIGNYGEDLSVKYLSNLGYKILNRNFRCKLGEIDIISMLESDNRICFTEVKSRYNSLYGFPFEAITYRKIKRIKAAAKFYIMVNNLKNLDFRFDVIEVVFNNSNDSYCLNLIENAF
ncbi:MULTISPECIES: YraN family protein [Clostridium]|uniref:UPF0102 protein CLCOL_05390 n=2 Tax=Clostridium TaxID=1485 RepID=A0A151AQI5_9CLOT|nr:MULTISPECIES: YraN family protein [Clostridium]KYH29901.1 hypothetical protein CLCOL_05390 [Clostridium colicanis DSM 13634]MBE6044104.1 YraN family protein [Clostridium thermopalmarium]PRR75282.1 hypothetical protein CPAL_08340 [Clostridium thermopalmarium DSM 5974]PVZ28038.1 putative endonuclease [Clostridium thermopalmarium DSM 5974]